METNVFREELLGIKAELESRLERTHKHIYQKDEPVSANFNEQIKQKENDELVIALEADGIEEIAQINNALARIDAGTFNTCAQCGDEIGEERLRAIPFTDCCIKCAEQEKSD